MTDWEVASKVTIPWVRSGIIGASVLGLGRALGETVAVAIVSGSILHLAPNVFGIDDHHCGHHPVPARRGPGRRHRIRVWPPWLSWPWCWPSFRSASTWPPAPSCSRTSSLGPSADALNR